MLTVHRLKRMTPLERVNKAQALLKQAHVLLQSQITIEYVDLARAQIAVAYKNLEDHRRFNLDAVPNDANSLTELVDRLQGKRKERVPIGLPEPYVDTELDDEEGA